MAHDPEQLATYLVKIILQCWHSAARVAFPAACGAARPLALPLLLSPCWMELAFLSGTHSTDGLGKGTKPEEQTSHFFHFLEVALSKGCLGRSLQPSAKAGALFSAGRHPRVLPSTTALGPGRPGVWTPPSLVWPWCQRASPTQRVPRPMFF